MWPGPSVNPHTESDFLFFYYDMTATSGVLLLPKTPVKVTTHWLSGSLGDGLIVDDFTRSVPKLISRHYEDTGPLHLLHHLLS